MLMSVGVGTIHNNRVTIDGPHSATTLQPKPLRPCLMTKPQVTIVQHGPPGNSVGERLNISQN